jgi:hypothetical protein
MRVESLDKTASNAEATAGDIVAVAMAGVGEGNKRWCCDGSARGGGSVVMITLVMATLEAAVMTAGGMT